MVYDAFNLTHLKRNKGINFITNKNTLSDNKIERQFEFDSYRLTIGESNPLQRNKMRIAPIAVALFQLTNVDAFGTNNFASWVPSSTETFRSKASSLSVNYSPLASSRRASRLYSEKTQSLADLEDEVEKRLDSQNTDQTLQHSLRAPTKLQQSSQSYSIQEETFKDEDQEAIERQNTIRRLLDEDDAKWKEERKRKILGKYADAKSQEDIKKLNDEEQRKIDQGEFSGCCQWSHIRQIVPVHCDYFHSSHV